MQHLVLRCKRNHIPFEAGSTNMSTRTAAYRIMNILDDIGATFAAASAVRNRRQPDAPGSTEHHQCLAGIQPTAVPKRVNNRRVSNQQG